MDKKRAYVYGLGRFYEVNRQWIHDNYEVIGYIDNAQQKFNKMIGTNRIMTINEVNFTNDTIIVLSVANSVTAVELCLSVQKIKGINCDIVFAGNEAPKMRSNFKLFAVEEGILCQYNTWKCVVRSVSEFVGFAEVFVNETYAFRLNSNLPIVVIDIGMNVGDSVIYFSRMQNVKAIYSWELFKHSYEFAIRNIELYSNKETEIHLFSYGLSDRNMRQMINYYCDASTAMSLNNTMNKEASESYGVNDGVKEEVTVKKSSDVLRKILNNNEKYNYVLKCDCEGEEFRIINDLFDNKLLHMFKIVMIEWHYDDKSKIQRKLEDAGFSWWSKNESSQMGFIVGIK